MTHRQDSFTGTVTTITWHFRLSPGDLLGAGRVISAFKKHYTVVPYLPRTAEYLKCTGERAIIKVAMAAPEKLATLCVNSCSVKKKN